MKLLVVVALCVLGLAYAQASGSSAEVLTQRLQQASQRAARAGGLFERFKQVGVQQIGRLRELILANQHCESMQGITAPEVPQPPATTEEEEEAEGAVTELTAEQASAALDNIDQALTKLEQDAAKMSNVGKTKIEIFSQFIQATGGKLCENSDEDDD